MTWGSNRNGPNSKKPFPCKRLHLLQSYFRVLSRLSRTFRRNISGGGRPSGGRGLKTNRFYRRASASATQPGRLMSPVVIFGVAAAFCLSGQTLETHLRRADEFLRRGAYLEANVDLTQALVTLQGAKPTRLMVTVLNNLAGVQADLGNHRDAEKLYLRSLRIWEQLDATDRPSRLSIQQNILVLCLQAGWFRKAERIVEESAGDFQAADPGQRIHFLDCTGNLRRAQKRLAESEAFYREALDLAQATSDSDAAGFLWNSIGVVRAERRRMTEAVDAFERALDSHERAGRRQHPALIATLTNLGAAYLATNRVAQAQAELARAGSLAERFFGSSHSSLYRILLMEAKAFDRMNRRAQARQARQRAHAISRTSAPRNPGAFVVDIEDLRRR